MSMIIFQLYTMVDGIYIANIVGDTALSAVNLSAPFINGLFSFAILFATGTSTLVSIYLGEGKKDKARSLFTLNFTFLSICGIVITILSHFFFKEIAYFLGATEVTLPYVKSYLGVLIYFSYFYIVSYSLEVLVKADGYPIISTLAIIVGAITNIVLDGVLMIIFHMGIFGAAIATGLSQVLTFSIFFIHFMKKKGPLYFSSFQFDLSVYKKIIPLGLSDFFTEISAGYIVFILNHAILKYIGNEGVTTYTVLTYIYNIILMSFTGIAQGTQPQISYYHGKKDKEKIQTLLKYAFLTTLIVSIISLIISECFTSNLIQIFISKENSNLFHNSIIAMKEYSLCYIVAGYNIVTASYFASIEKSKYSFTISSLRGFVCITLSVLFISFIGKGTGIWFSSLLSEFLCFIVSILIFKKNV